MEVCQHRQSNKFAINYRLVLIIIILFIVAACASEHKPETPDKVDDTQIDPQKEKEVVELQHHYSLSLSTNQTNVSVYETIVLTSSKILDASIINENNFYLRSMDTIIESTISFTETTITLKPTHTLQPLSDYTLFISKDIIAYIIGSSDFDITLNFHTAALDLPPLFDRWKSNMVSFGENVATYIINDDNPRDFLLDAFYYDAQYVFYQIGEFTGDTDKWNAYAIKAGQQYESRYLTPNNYKIAGYWRFPHGIYEQWKRSGEVTLANRLKQLRDGPAYSDPLTNGYANTWYSQRVSREIAYAIESNILAEKAGVPRDQARLDVYIDMALQHIDSWVSGNWIITNEDDQYVKPFMTGLTAGALIEYYEHLLSNGEANTRTEAIIPAIKSIADWTWENMWVPDMGGRSPQLNDQGGTGYGAFVYMSKQVAGKGGPNPAPDLNLLIAPHYAWLYLKTCEQTYKEKADLIFAGGVQFAYLGWGKQFNQNYRKSFKFLQWREAGNKNCS